jgi:hypothetical protein
MKRHWQIFVALLIIAFPVSASYIIPNQAVTQGKLALRPSSSASPAPIGDIAVSSSTSSFSTSSGSLVAVTNAIVTITTVGRPVMVTLIPDGTSSSAFISVSWNTSTANYALAGTFEIFRDGSAISYHELGVGGFNSGTNLLSNYQLPGSITYVDFPSAGAHTYQLKAQAAGGGAGVGVNNCSLVAYEM